MILVSAILDKIETLKDKTLKLVFQTNEIKPAQGGELFTYSQSFCFLAIKKETFDDDQVELIESLKVEEFDKKSQSKRMRDILFRLWQIDNAGYSDFNLYYDYRMTDLCDMLKTEFPR